MNEFIEVPTEAFTELGVEYKTVSIFDIKPNPTSKEFVKDKFYDNILKSLVENPKYSGCFPLHVFKDMVVIGSNLIFTAILEAGIIEVPVKIYPANYRQ